MLKFSQVIFSIFMLLFLVAPIFIILPLAFTDSLLFVYPIERYSGRWFYDIFHDPVWFNAIINTIIVGLGTTVLSVILGTLAAVGLREKIRFRAVFHTLFFLPMTIPAVVLGVGMQVIFSQLDLMNSYIGLIIAHTVLAVPFVIITVTNSLKAIDRKLEFAAASLSANPVKVFTFITVPLALPGIISGAVLALATSLDEVILTMFLSGPSQRTLARQMFITIKEKISPAIAAAAFILIIATLIIMALMAYWQYRRKKLQVS